MIIELKNFDLADKPYMWKTYVAAMKQHIEEMWGWDEVWQENNFNNELAQSNTQIIFAGGDRVGYLQTEQESCGIFIRMIILEPKHQSKGIGEKILDMLQPSLVGQLLKLNCFEVNKEAFRFYQKNGFTVTSTDKKFIRMQRATKG